MRKSFVLNLKKKPTKILLDLKGQGNVRFVGVDAKGTLFFERNKELNGTETLVFPMPITPEKLLLEIEGNFAVKNLRTEKLKTSPQKFDAEQHAFFKHIFEFVSKFPTLSGGIYTDEQGRFPIVLSKEIRDRETGAIKNTPARVSRNTGQIEVSKTKFKNYSLPVQVFILLHERSHYVLNTSNEIEADLQALNWYLSLGFPQTEALYAHTKVFSGNNPEHKARLMQLIDYIKHYNYEKGHYCFNGCACNL